MTESTLLDALVEVRRTGGLLHEILDLSRQLAEAVDRDDQVSIRMLVSMRGEPIERLRQTDQALRHMLKVMPDQQDARHLAGLLNGTEKPAPEERALAERVEANARLLRQVRELDRALNRRLTREKSIYDGQPGAAPAENAPVGGAFSGMA